MKQLSLDMPIQAEATCGYCLRKLVLHPEGDWRCPRCAPILEGFGKGRTGEDIVTEFKEFRRAAWKARSAEAAK